MTFREFASYSTNNRELQMLHPHTSAKSTAVIIDVIRELSGDTSFITFNATISVTINGAQKIDNEIIRVLLTNSRPNYALVDVIWEDFGYKNYRDMGLFGRMTTQWQEVKKVAARTFRVFGDTYQIDVTY